MPYFYQEVEVDIDVFEFLNSCKSHEIDEVIEWIDEHVKSKRNVITHSDEKSFAEDDWFKLTEKLHNIRLRISDEDEKQIREILNKY